MRRTNNKIPFCPGLGAAQIVAMVVLLSALCARFANTIFDGGYFLSAAFQMCIMAGGAGVPKISSLLRPADGRPGKLPIYMFVVLSMPNAIFMFLSYGGIFDADGMPIGGTRGMVLAVSVSLGLFVLHLVLSIGAFAHGTATHGACKNTDGRTPTENKLFKPTKI